jgi:hypothetical protein
VTRRTSDDVVLQGELRFDGTTYDPPQDRERLTAQLAQVRALMADGRWRTLAAIAMRTGAPEASVSARLRDLRKPRFGGYRVDRRRVTDGHGLHEYRLGPAAAR